MVGDWNGIIFNIPFNSNHSAIQQRHPTLSDAVLALFCLRNAPRRDSHLGPWNVCSRVTLQQTPPGIRGQLWAPAPERAQRCCAVPVCRPRVAAPPAGSVAALPSPPRPPDGSVRPRTGPAPCGARGTARPGWDGAGTARPPRHGRQVRRAASLSKCRARGQQLWRYWPPRR